MAIESVRISSDVPGRPRLIYYEATDDSGGVHQYGPVISHDADFDADAFRATVGARLAESLAEREFADMIG